MTQDVFAEACRRQVPVEQVREEMGMGEAECCVAETYDRKPHAPPIPDVVNHPPHYTRGTIEPIDFIESQEFNFALGCVVKYVTRAGHKGDRLEDLEKAKWYLQREIDRERKLRE